MSSSLSAQNLQTLRRRNSVRRWPFSLSPGFLSRLAPGPPPPRRRHHHHPSVLVQMPWLHLYPVKSIVFGLVRFAGRTPLARLPLRRQPALHAAALGPGPPLGARPLDDLLLLIDADDHVPDHQVQHLEAAVELLHQLART